jgi:diguanylate cyclase
LISLKECIAAYDKELADAFRSACRATLIATAQSGGLAVPTLAGNFRENLNLLQRQLSSAASPSDVARLEEEIEREISQWGDAASQSSLDNLKQIREVMMAVAASAAAIAERDHRYANRFKNLTDRLQSVARLDDVASMRSSVVESASELKNCVEQMTEESESSLSQLQAEVAHYRAELKEYQKRDGTDLLTGLANRQAIDAQIEDRMAWSTKFSLAIMDMNGFKQINDTYGHAAGDDLLKQFSAELRSLLRSTDVVGRWGGDEFVFVIDSSLEEATKSLDRVRDWAFGEYEIKSGAESITVRVTAATGIAEWDGTESAEALFNRADQLMYCDKKSRSTLQLARA